MRADPGADATKLAVALPVAASTSPVERRRTEESDDLGTSHSSPVERITITVSTRRDYERMPVVGRGQCHGFQVGRSWNENGRVLEKRRAEPSPPRGHGR